jgi:hypothetical protein
MNVKAALDIYKGMEAGIKSDRKVGLNNVTPEELALRTMVSAFLKQRLVIKQLQKDNSNLKKVAKQWISFRNSL